MALDVVDLFAGPGGLGEGFTGFASGSVFKLAVSVEMEASAHQTLTLRSFFRRVRGDAKGERVYYGYCQDSSAQHPREAYPSAWNASEVEARRLTLGDERDNKTLNAILDAKRLNPDRTVVIGGPPCQAYSLMGRARNRGKFGYEADKDHRNFLYREYLRVLHRLQPAVFVMENVKGILSSRVGGRRVFHDILSDLAQPGKALRRARNDQGHGYRIHSLVCDTAFASGDDPESVDPTHFVIRAEQFGIPQTRHRVILLGVREDIPSTNLRPLEPAGAVTLGEAISSLPALRSRLSTGDSERDWLKTVAGLAQSMARDAAQRGMPELEQLLSHYRNSLHCNLPIGALRVPRQITKMASSSYLDWVQDNRLQVWLNHEARTHMASDLGRYFYASVFAKAYSRSPKGSEDFMLKGLAPAHANWETGKFADRFRVQRIETQSSTVTSHISKDGHYFIHADPVQCRSLTVREAARLQSFPDNYFFQGNRTQQYHQVGNAVPSLLANRIAERVAALISPAK